eukprot:351601-Prymnesium_polylepis.1
MDLTSLSRTSAVLQPGASQVRRPAPLSPSRRRRWPPAASNVPPHMPPPRLVCRLIRSLARLAAKRR